MFSLKLFLYVHQQELGIPENKSLDMMMIMTVAVVVVTVTTTTLNGSCSTFQTTVHFIHTLIFTICLPKLGVGF